jgi:hypothetical protein
MKHSQLILIVFGVIATFTACAGPAANETRPAAGQSDQAAAVRTSGDVVKVTAAGIEIAGGSSADLSIPISIQPGYHVNANPATFDYLIATEVTVDKSEGLVFGKPVYPASEKKKFQFADQPLAVYEGSLQIKLPVQAATNSAKGKRSVGLHVRVQACDEEKCFPPDTLQSTAVIDLK